MQGFSGKILPEGLEIFPENRRLDLAFPLKSRNYLCAQNENDYLMRLTERRKNGGKRKWRQIGKKKNFREKSVIKEISKRKWHCRERETGQTTGKEVWVSVWLNSFGRTDAHSSRFACCGWRLAPFMGRAVAHGFPLPVQMNRKRKIIWKPVKAPLWHKHKRNGLCTISLNHCLGVIQSPFLRLCGSRDTFVQNSFWAMVVPTDKTAFTENLVYEGEKK